MIFVSVSSFDKKYDKNMDAIKYEDEIESVICTVTSFPVHDDGKFKFTGEICNSETEGFNGLKMNISIKNGDKYDFKPGDTVEIRNALYFAPSPKTNEGGFDGAKFHKSENTYGNIYTEDEVSLKAAGKNRFLRAVSDIRNSFMENSDKLFKANLSGIAKALVTGESASIDADDSEILKTSGIYHIVSISGLHLNIFIMLITSFISGLKLKRKNKALLSAAICTITALFVLLFTGFGLAVIRAFVMLVISLGSGLFARRYSAKNALSLGTAIILMITPSSFYNAGFQLSVLSTYAVLCSADIIKKMKASPKLARISGSNLTGVVVTSLLCSLFTLPVMMDSFGYLPVHSWLANLGILLIATPSLVLCVLFGIVSICGFSSLAKLISYPVSALLQIILEIADFVSSLPFATLNLYPRYTAYFILIPAVTILCIWLIYKKRTKLCIIFALIFIIAVNVFLMYNKDDEARVIFADVGQGECAIIDLPGEDAVMMDFGSTSEEEYIIDEIKSTLVKLNIRKLSAVFVSHMHEDHVSGVIELVKESLVRNVFIPKYYDKSDEENSDNIHSLMEACLKTNTSLHRVQDGSSVKLGDHAVFEVLSPRNDMFFDANNMSAVVKFTYGKLSFLFTGDITENGTKALEGKDIDCDILKLPHHGGKNALTGKLIEKTSPKYAVASCAENNIYGHPDPDVVMSLKDTGVELFRTDKMGAVTFEFNRESIKNVETMR